MATFAIAAGCASSPVRTNPTAVTSPSAENSPTQRVVAALADRCVDDFPTDADEPAPGAPRPRLHAIAAPPPVGLFLPEELPERERPDAAPDLLRRTLCAGGRFVADRELVIRGSLKAHPDHPVRGIAVVAGDAPIQRSSDEVARADWSGHDHGGRVIFVKDGRIFRRLDEVDIELTDLKHLDRLFRPISDSVIHAALM